ncbi:RING-H2 finger protein ATL56-like [Lycium ferocissimum]|uniref:RING-H2 finger protein ATL56-like n=1 Tax=Lycium ferocissimum TaxID=112874 RepID=UPI002815E45B|nr:RING-H2 finger protein ATL56-like [Lycium ferocissimum]
MKNHELGIATRFTRVIVMAIVISVILLLVFVGVLVLIHICVILRNFRGRTDNINMGERGNFGSNSMSQEDIEKLPCFDFQAKEKGSSSSVDCAICLDNLKVGDKCRPLPQCNHSFHAECIDLWLLKSPFCPICRASANVLRGCSN